MKITSVDTFYLRLPDIEARTDSSQDALIVRVETDAGIIGWGEVDSSPAVIRAIVDAPYSHTMVTGLRGLLIGENPLETGRLWEKMSKATIYYGHSGAVTQAMAGIDIALWDIKGKAFGQPIVTLLSGAMRDRMRVYSSNMFQFRIEDTLDRARAAVDTGHTGIKFGWEPFGQDARTDIAWIEALRKEIGSDVDLMLDVRHAWDARTARSRARAFEPYDLFWIEGPLLPDDLDGYRQVADHCLQPIAAGEQESSVAGFQRLIDQGGVDVVQIDLTRTGFTQAIRIADYARLRGRRVCNHNFTTDINTAASLHFLCAIQTALAMEYCVEPGEISRSLDCNPVRIADGHAHLPTEPGLGVEPNMEIIERFAVT